VTEITLPDTPTSFISCNVTNNRRHMRLADLNVFAHMFMLITWKHKLNVIQLRWNCVSGKIPKVPITVDDNWLIYRT